MNGRFTFSGCILRLEDAICANCHGFFMFCCIFDDLHDVISMRTMDIVLQHIPLYKYNH